MQSFFVNLNEEITHLDIGYPLLYKTIDAEILHLIDMPSGSFSQKLKHACLSISNILNQSRKGEWQLLFLVDLYDHSNQSSLKNSLTAKLKLINELLIKPLENFDPTNIFVIVSDFINNRAHVSEKIKGYNESLLLDTQGYYQNLFNSNTFDFVLNTLDKQWENERKLPGSEIIDSFNNLTVDSKERLNAFFKQAQNQISDLLSELSTNNQLLLDAEESIYLLNKEQLKLVQATINEKLVQAKASPMLYNNFSISSLLKDILKNEISLFSYHYSNINLLRINCDKSHIDLFSEALIKINTLIYLISNSKDVGIIIQEKHTASYVDIDLHKLNLGQVFFNYHHNLNNQIKVLTNNLKDLNSAELDIINETNCSTEFTLSNKDVKFKPIKFGFIYKNTSLQNWTKWMSTNNSNLNEIEEDIKKTISKTIDYNSKKVKPISKQEVENLDYTLEQYKDTKERLKQKVQQSNSFIPNDQGEVSNYKTEIRELLLQRPTKRYVLYTILIASLLVCVPLFFKEQNLYYYIIYAVAIICALSYAYLESVRFYLKKIELNIINTVDYFRSIKNNKLDNFDRQKLFLENLCQLSNARYNLNEAEKKRTQNNEIKVKLNYHISQLKNQSLLSKKALKICTPIHDDSKLNIMNFEFDIDKSEIENNVYQLEQYMPPKTNNDVVYILNRKLDDDHLQLKNILERADFIVDKIYHI